MTLFSKLLNKTFSLFPLHNCCVKCNSKLYFPGEGHIRGGYGPHMDVNAVTLAPSHPPQFDPTHSADVTALAGKTALLNCRVHNINNKTVSKFLKLYF